MLVGSSVGVHGGGCGSRPCVCMFIPSFHPIIGGAEQQAGQLARKLIDKGLKVFVLTRQIKGTGKFEVLNGVPVYRTFAKFHTIFFLLSSFLFLIRHKKKYDIIHVHTLDSPAFVACAVKKTLNKGVIVKIREKKSFLNVTRGYLGKIKLKFIASSIDYFITVSRELESEVKRMGVGEDRIRTISNGVDTHELQSLLPSEKLSLRRRLNLPEGKITVFVGRLVKRKRVDLIIEVWSSIIDSMPESYLLIIGKGPEQEKVRKIVEKYHLCDTVILRGECSHSLAIKYMQASDVFVSASESEGMPNAILEAMSAGLPVVGSRIGGTEDIIIDESNGLLFEAGNKQQLQTKLVKILSKDEYRKKLSNGARGTVENKFSFDIISDMYIALYREVAQRNSSGAIIQDGGNCSP